MIKIDEDQETIHITRGDSIQKEFNRLSFYFPIYNFTTKEIENYLFKLTDKITFAVVNKKGYTKEEIFRLNYTLEELGYTEPTEIVEIPITEKVTKLFPRSNKKQVYWYDIVLNDTTTILGFDESGAKKIIVYPEVEEE